MTFTRLIFCSLLSMYCFVLSGQQLFNQELSKKKAAKTSQLNEKLIAYDLYELDHEILRKVTSEQPASMELNWTYAGQEYIIELERNDRLFTPDFSVVAGNKTTNEQVTYTGGAYYHGTLKGVANSLVALSFFDENIIGVVSSSRLGNVNIGILNVPYTDGKSLAIAYQDRAVIDPPNFDCETVDIDPLEHIIPTPPTSALVNNTLCFSSYLELDHALYLENGASISQATDFITGAFNVVAVLYDNEQITAWISEIFVWTSPDGYPTTNSSDALVAFRGAMSGGFNGDLAHLISRTDENLGGRAYIDVLCDSGPDFRTAYSNIYNSYSQFPNYSWTVNVLTHEIGHNLGSPHTHDCAWNGNNTQIDDCGNQWLDDPNPCYDENNPILPPNGDGGTIMSYCHLISGVGMDFNEGFGPQPGDLIRNRIQNCTNCPVQCDVPADIQLASVGYSHFRFEWDNSTTTTTNIQYRAIGDPDWIFLEDYDNGNHISLNKVPCTGYEWQIQGVCEDGVSNWSDSYFATTTGCDDPYCYAYGNSFENWIERIAVAEIDNSSGNDYGYANYTDQVAELLGGLTYSITLDPDANGAGTGADVFWIGWIDYNRDNDFNDPGEEIFTTTSGSQNPINVSFTIPSTLNNGFSRMRIAMSVDGTPDLCQIGGNGDVEDYGVYIESVLSELSVNPTNVFFDAPGGTEDITVSSNIDWTVTESAPWFSVSPTSGSGNGNFTITCDPNPGTTNRTATITITGGGLTRTVTVEQAGLTPMLTVTPTNVFFDAPGGTEDITVSSNIDWTVTESAPWFSVSPISGSGDGNFTITCDPNPGTTNRTATITITGGGLTRTVTVEQAGLTPMLTATPANVFFDATGGTEEVTVSSNIDWTVTENAPWFSVSPLSGSGDGSFIIDCDPNPGTTSRTATITITGGGITIIVTVEQAGTEPFLFVNPENVFFDATGGSEEVTVNSNIDWTVTENSPWFSVSPTSGSSNGSFIIDCDPNPSTTSRTATITITGGGLTRTVTVEQAGVTPILLVSPPLVLFDAIGGMEEVTVSSNIGWTVTESAPWFSLSPANGSGDGSFTITCTPNPGTSTRTGTITITGGGITRTVTVQQGGTDPFLLVNPETVFFAASGGSQNVIVSSNVNWSVSENASWFNINPANGSGNGSFIITCQFNPDPQGRSSTITVTGGGITRTIIVEQAGNSIELTVDPQLVFFNAPGGTDEVTVSSNTAWTVSENASWFSVSPMNGNGNGSFIIDCMPNMTAQTRTATITITGGGETVTVVVEQLGEAVSLSVTPENVFFEAAGGTETAVVSSNVSWTASDNAAWLTLNPSSGNGNGNFTITCQPYTGTQPRTATITVTGGGITRTITVEQAGIQPFLSANPTTVFFAAIGGMNQVTVNSNLNWTVSEGATWLTLSPQTGNGIGSFVINCDPNPGTQIRNALITLSGGGLERIIEVGQAGAVPYLTVNQDFIYFNPPGGSGEIELSSNISWIVTSSETWASITPVSGNGNASLYVDCLVNNNPDPREAVFTIIGGGINTSFTLEQLGTSIFCQDSETIIDTMLCAGQSITIGNNTYTETGIYENLFQTPDGCDSLITLDLEVFDVAQLLPSELTTCPGQSVTLSVPAGYEVGLMGVPSGNTLSLNVGTYEVTIADDLFACTATQTVTVVEEGLGVAISGQATICANEPHPLQATPAATYLWSTNETTATINVSAPGTYCVTATDASGCEGSSCFEVTEDLTFPSFSDCPEDQLVTVDPGETAAAIDWIPPFATDNCGNDPLVVQSSHEPGSIFNVGTTAVSYTVTDANGNVTTCTFSVTVQTTPTEDLTFYIDTTGFTRSGDTICVPVRVLNFTEVAAFQFSLAAPDEMQSSLITIDAVAPLTNIDGVGGLFYQEETPNLGQLLWLNPTGDGLTLADSTAIFQIKMFVDTPAGECVPLALTGVPLAPEAFVVGEGAVIPDLLDGSICVNNLIDIIGETYKITNEPINLTEVSLIAVDTTRMDTTDVAGRYDFNQVLAAIDYTVLPARDFGDAEGLSVLDMIGILRHIQGRTIITNPYILLAADVNLTGSITIADILEVRELILNNVQAFPNTTSWFFVPVAYEFPDPLNPWLEPVPDRVELIAPTDDQDIDFYGIKSGDINLSNDGQNLTTGTLDLAFAEQEFSAGATIDVPVYAANLAAISGFQLGLNIDPGYLQIVEVLPGTTALDAGALTFGVHDREEGELPIVFLREQPQAGTVSDGPLFTLRLAARAAGRLSEVLQLDNRILTQQAFDDDLQAYTIELTTTALTNTLEPQQAVARLVHVQPNPFRQQLQLDFYFRKSTDLKVELLDVQGRVHYFSAMQTNTGRNTVTIAPEQSLSNGIYFCRWQTADASGVVKVVKE